MKKGKHRKTESSASKFFMGVAFCIGKEGPELYMNTIDQLGLYASTQFGNGSDVMKCLKNGKVIKPAITKLPDEDTAHKNKVREYMVELVTT